MPYEPIVPEGTHLGNSHAVDGARVAHLFDNETNKLVGHAPLRWVDPHPEPADQVSSYGPEPEVEEEHNELAEAVAALIVLGLMVAVAAATPRIKRWWDETGAPLAAATRKRIGGFLQLKRRPSDAPTTSIFVASTSGVLEAISSSPVTMSSTEWDQRLQSAISTGAFTEAQKRSLTTFGQGTAQEQLAPDQFFKRVTLMLKANPSLLEPSASAELVKVFTPRA